MKYEENERLAGLCRDTSIVELSGGGWHPICTLAHLAGLACERQHTRQLAIASLLKHRRLKRRSSGGGIAEH